MSRNNSISPSRLSDASGVKTGPLSLQDSSCDPRIQVWADVGGTFTDCFVVIAQRRRSAKVLSSGVIRFAVVARSRDGSIKIHPDTTFPNLPDDFWNTSRVSRLEKDGQTTFLGIVTQFDAAESTLRLSPREFSIAAGDVIELAPQIEAPVLATRLLLGTALTTPLPPVDVRLGTTRGTNALLTRRGANTALLVTAGFADVLRIGEQDRPDLFELAICKPPPLTERTVEVVERLDGHGNVLVDLDLEKLRTDLEGLRAARIESLAICLMHAHVSDVHEQAVERLARELGFDQISRSSEVAPLIKLVSRAETTTLDAYLNPILSDYVARVLQQFGGLQTCRLQLMTSAGNLVTAEDFRGRDSILSGPAGGVVALAHVAKAAAVDAAIGLDMGGTSTDVSRFDGRVGRRFESRVAGLRVMTSMMDIQTVAAGGGSICEVLDGRMAVGPDSAGAAPGPACYGRGGPLTVTDINVLLGRLPVDRFPFPLDRDAALRRLEQVAAKLPGIQDLDTLAEGFLQIAITHMAEAVRTVSTAEGNDVRKMSLVGFGGAAAQHLCRIADSLGMTTIIDHPDCSTLSALGMGLADVGRVVTRGIYEPIGHQTRHLLTRISAELRQDALQQLKSEWGNAESACFRYECDIRYVGTESPLAIPMEPSESLVDRFHRMHLKTFGYDRPHRAVELVALRCEATLGSSLNSIVATDAVHESNKLHPTTHHGTIERRDLQAGDQIEAPAMIISNDSTLVVEPNWVGQVLPGGIIRLIHDPADVADVEAVMPHASDDPVLLEVITRRLQGIADAMGEVLRRTSVSVNVKERRDYSCAVFRGDGSLIANAPHVPVHLGAMGHTVRHVMKRYPNMSAGDCYLSNDPFSGGSHLPDVTAVTPVFCDEHVKRGHPDFFVASRAHHAEIGGRTPGSMPPDARSLAEEGVLLRDFAFVRDGTRYENELRKRLQDGPYPSRNVEENLADIAAQQAAGLEGVSGLVEMSRVHSVVEIDRYMQRLLDVAAETAATWIASLPNEPMRFCDELDDGTTIKVCLTRDNQRLTIDFTGTDTVHPFGFNATPSIVNAAVLYVVRSVSGSNLPLCEGVLRDIDLVIPPGLLNPPGDEDPTKCAAVVAGNVETSQRVVDVLLGALHVAAASQGTMNNVLIGDATFGYYETIGGGSGATPFADGVDAVHTHMTNTRITDPEVIEQRLPLRLHRFAIRLGSGGEGRFRGGDGMIREMEFLRPLTLSLITGRRTRDPYGIDGGSSGKRGRNTLVHQGRSIELPWATTIHVEEGDRLILETPGGGGWGSETRRPVPPHENLSIQAPSNQTSNGKER
ncbi:hydantoinase B/oxoprolinase family protein [Novipirellula artificiosorum]|uniref:Acetophenone carboxylase gamma subunit n=1 Tax=Novipirellula artificiosorum TaxID=2528016 RepID=A0A5C6DCQ6_9BACT|nr:hydantoinase B/oxoprolinase family protein [Novipirellula artificiosorum]TWU33006.1 Acetophenone carboxylase gamma subunit [Novipirellula artificiosorum]